MKKNLFLLLLSSPFLLAALLFVVGSIRVMIAGEAFQTKVNIQEIIYDTEFKEPNNLDWQVFLHFDWPSPTRKKTSIFFEEVSYTGRYPYTIEIGGPWQTIDSVEAQFRVGDSCIIPISLDTKNVKTTRKGNRGKWNVFSLTGPGLDLRWNSFNSIEFRIILRSVDGKPTVGEKVLHFKKRSRVDNHNWFIWRMISV